MGKVNKNEMCTLTYEDWLGSEEGFPPDELLPVMLSKELCYVFDQNKISFKDMKLIRKKQEETYDKYVEKIANAFKFKFSHHIKNAKFPRKLLELRIKKTELLIEPYLELIYKGEKDIHNVTGRDAIEVDDVFSYEMSEQYEISFDEEYLSVIRSDLINAWGKFYFAEGLKNLNLDDSNFSDKIFFGKDLSQYQGDEYWEIARTYHKTNILPEVYERISTEMESNGLKRRHSTFESFSNSFYSHFRRKLDK